MTTKLLIEHMAAWEVTKPWHHWRVVERTLAPHGFVGGRAAMEKKADGLRYDQARHIFDNKKPPRRVRPNAPHP